MDQNIGSAIVNNPSNKYMLVELQLHFVFMDVQFELYWYYGFTNLG